MIEKLIPLITAAAFICACSTSTGSGGMSIQEIRSELDRRACIALMDDLAFELESGLYHGKYGADQLDSVVMTMPDSIGCCPGTQDRFEIRLSEEPRIVCPNGHGAALLAL